MRAKGVIKTRGVTHGTTLGLFTYLGNVTLEKYNVIVTLSRHWLLLDNSMSMYELLSGICELL